jgi:hypothetical protein
MWGRNNKIGNKCKEELFWKEMSIEEGLRISTSEKMKEKSTKNVSSKSVFQ